MGSTTTYTSVDLEEWCPTWHDAELVKSIYTKAWLYPKAILWHTKRLLCSTCHSEVLASQMSKRCSLPADKEQVFRPVGVPVVGKRLNKKHVG